MEIQGERADNKQEQEDTRYEQGLPSEERKMPQVRFKPYSD